jgi:hypothetical protein
MKRTGNNGTSVLTDWEPTPRLKRAMREVNAGIGLVRVGSTKAEIKEWTRRVYERACKKQKG